MVHPLRKEMKDFTAWILLSVVVNSRDAGSLEFLLQ